MDINDKHCRSCKYHGWLGNHALTCDYILIKKQRRGCPTGPGCIRYEKGERKRDELGPLSIPKEAIKP